VNKRFKNISKVSLAKNKMANHKIDMDVIAPNMRKTTFSKIIYFPKRSESII